MLKLFKKLFSPGFVSLEDKRRSLQVASAAIYINMAKADGHYSDEEKEKISQILQQFFNVDENYIKDLMEESEVEIKKSISLYEFTKIINEYLSYEGLVRVLLSLSDV
jgi:uncharacterized tellurite resistance protein B-like protein